MAVRKVLRLGDPKLREVSQPVAESDLGSKELKKLIRDLFDTMDDYDGAGLAAPQVGVQKRIFVTGSEKPSENGKEMVYEKRVFINPQLESLTDHKEGFWEGCLSVPGMRGLVERPRRIRLKWIDENMEQRDEIIEGFDAVVYQHEFDHLDGILYVDRLKDPRMFGYNEELDEARADRSR